MRQKKKGNKKGKNSIHELGDEDWRGRDKTIEGTEAKEKKQKNHKS